MPLAIDRATWIAVRPRRDRTVLLHSLDQTGVAEFVLNDLQKGGAPWGEYPKGVASGAARCGF